MDKSKSATAVFKLSAGLTVSIEAADEPVEGTEWVVRVSITDVVDLTTYQFEVLYDPAVVTVTSIEPGVIGETAWPVNPWEFVPLKVQGTVLVVNHVSPLSPVSGSGFLAELHFQVNGMAGKVGNISIQNGKLFNSLGRQIAPVNWGCATVTIG